MAQLDFFEIDEQPANEPLNNSSHLCQLCENYDAVVALSCGCQQMCVNCFKEYAMTDTGGNQRGLTPSGDPVIDADNPMKCPHCTNSVTFYIITRR